MAIPARILLVEDHSDTLLMLTRLLESRGFDVVRADSCQSAREVAVQASLDLAVVDIGLPDGSGLDLIQELKRRLGVPALAITGYGTSGDTAQYREAGADWWLVKPVEAAPLLGAVDALLSRQDRPSLPPPPPPQGSSPSAQFF